MVLFTPDNNSPTARNFCEKLGCKLLTCIPAYFGSGKASDVGMASAQADFGPGPLRFPATDVAGNRFPSLRDWRGDRLAA
jgi:hypothetical protein